MGNAKVVPMQPNSFRWNVHLRWIVRALLQVCWQPELIEDLFDEFQWVPEKTNYFLYQGDSMMAPEKEYLKRISAHLFQIKWTVWLFSVIAFIFGLPVNFSPVLSPVPQIRPAHSSESKSQTTNVSFSSVSSSSNRKLVANIEGPESISVTGSLLDH